MKSQSYFCEADSGFDSFNVGHYEGIPINHFIQRHNYSKVLVGLFLIVFKFLFSNLDEVMYKMSHTLQPTQPTFFVFAIWMLLKLKTQWASGNLKLYRDSYFLLFISRFFLVFFSLTMGIGHTQGSVSHADSKNICFVFFFFICSQEPVKTNRT